MAKAIVAINVARGHPCQLSQVDQHELCLYREAGVPIADLASMWRIAPGTVRKILAARAVAKKDLTRWRRLRMSGQRLRYAAPIPALAKWLSAPRPTNEIEVRP
jgi:hypothetical protein